ncbi:MAG: nitrophenyl compound nitroreductase subunit ArsF family protein [archaeon]
MSAKPLGVLLVLLVVIVISSGCVGDGKTDSDVGVNDTAGETAKIQLPPSNVEKIEVYHFHGTRQCYSCITVGAYAEETVNTYFADEVKSGKVVFGHVNVQLSENAALAEKYGATGSSLWIGVYDENGFHAEQNTNVWYKINDKADYMNYLKSVIEQKLAGELE